MNSITDLLDLEDANISISSIDIEGQTKTIYLESAPEAHFCPCCGFRMHFRGIKNRKINPVVDSFHVLQWITRSIDNYMRQLLKKYKQRDKERQKQLTTDPLHPVQLPVSDEVYILQKYRWLILSNQSNIRYHSDLRMDQHFHVLMNTYDYED